MYHVGVVCRCSCLILTFLLNLFSMSLSLSPGTGIFAHSLLLFRKIQEIYYRLSHLNILSIGTDIISSVSNSDTHTYIHFSINVVLQPPLFLCFFIEPIVSRSYRYFHKMTRRTILASFSACPSFSCHAHHRLVASSSMIERQNLNAFASASLQRIF